MKLAIILGTRPEIIRLSQIIKKATQFVELILIHTGQNWDPKLSEIFFKELKLPLPHYNLSTVGRDLGETLGNIISKSYTVLRKEMPDAVLILGDTNSSLAAISAKRLKIPIFHMEAGNRCFDYRVPEEINRILVDSISDINLAYTEHSRRNLINQGYSRDNIFVTGSPIQEVYDAYLRDINDDPILDHLQLKKDNYFVVSVHREENLDIADHLSRILQSLFCISEKYNKRIIFTTHPRTRLKLTSLNFSDDIFRNIELIDPVGLFSYIKLMKNSYCVISDSGTISEEATWLDIPAVTIREAIERPEAVENGNIIISGFDLDNLILSIRMARELPRISRPVDYQVKDVSSRVLKIILSYYHIVNKRTWNK